MDRSIAILVTLVVYQIALLGMGLLARRRTHDAADYYLGGRTLGPWVAALAANASSSSAWSLLGVSGFAYAFGLSALWLLPGCIGGFALNWWLVAPRIRGGSALTLTELLAGPEARRGQRAFVWLASLLTLGCLLVYVSSQMYAAGKTFLFVLVLPDQDRWLGVLVGAAVVVAYVFLGGYLAASITDTLQAVLMVAVAVLLPAVGLAAVGGVDALAAGLREVPVSNYTSLGGDNAGMVAVGFALGLCGIGLGYPGQPHAVNKYMGMREGASMAVARTVGMGWAVLLYCGMVLAGLCARLLVPSVRDREQALFVLAEHTLPPLLAGIVVAAVLAAMMSTVDSMLLVCASCVTHDLRLGRGQRSGAALLRQARLVVLGISAGAVVAAILVEATIFRYVLFAWSVLGSAFGPPLLVHLWRGPVRPPWLLLATAVGGGTALWWNFMPLLASGFGDRVLAWLLALAIAFCGAEPRRRR